VEKLEKRHLLSGGMVLVASGILMILHKTGSFGFDRSWPILLIVIGIGAIVQHGKDLGGWFITTAGVLLLLLQNWHMDIQMVSTYLLPLLLIGVGVNIIRKYFRKKE
jgi:hypothetical protein